MKPLELERALHKRDIAPLYFFHGEETYLIDRMVGILKATVVESHLADFNLTTFYAGESSARDIMNTARTFPLLSDRRLVIVKEADKLKTSSWKELSTYVTDPLPSTCLVFCAEKLALNATLLTPFKRKGEVVRFYHPFEREIAEWIRKMVKEFDKTITSDAVTLLCMELESDLQTIYSELQKIAAFVGEKKVIGKDEVREVLSEAGGASVFELIECIGNRDQESALMLLKRLLEAGEYPLKILTIISRHLRMLTQAKEMLKEGISSAEVGSTLGIRDFHLKGFLRQANSFSLAKAETYFTSLFRTDEMLKSSRIPKKLILERLIDDLCRN